MEYLTRAIFEKQLTALHVVRTFHLSCVFILVTKMRTETKTVPSTSTIFNIQGCILTDFHICALYGYWLTWGTGEFLSGKAKRCFRDWPFVYFHLSGDSANFNMWKSDYKNKRYQETGMEYFTKVQMIVKDEGYKYFAGRATFEGVTTSRATSGERRK